MAVGQSTGAMASSWEDGQPSVSVIVPVTDRPYPLGQLYREYSQPLRDDGWPFEFIFVLDDQWRHLAPDLENLREAGEPIRILDAGQSLSESAMLQVAASRSRAERLLSLPSYPRVDPRALPGLLRGLDAGFDLLTAARVNKSDAPVNRFQRRAFHGLLKWLVGGRLTDVASGVRAMRREVLEELDLYGDSFRFLPLLAIREGFQVLEVDVEQHPEDRKTRVYAPGVYVRRLIDLLGLMFLVRFAFKPLRFFGLVGSVLAVAGAAMLGVVFFQKVGGRGIADRPLLLLGVLLVVLGIQAVAMGLIGEIIVHQGAPTRKNYRVRGEYGGRKGGGTVEDLGADELVSDEN